VYNLCSERNYDPALFDGRVEYYPFDDHNAPPLQMIYDCCESVQQWLDAASGNVAVIHCKVGLKRTRRERGSHASCEGRQGSHRRHDLLLDAV
jgi:phosphatidylinositol-3,4,5-trisphosphate 3-phosphatase/dual-specificity protein phosphatase PTEN